MIFCCCWELVLFLSSYLGHLEPLCPCVEIILHHTDGGKRMGTIGGGCRGAAQSVLGARPKAGARCGLGERRARPRGPWPGGRGGGGAGRDPGAGARAQGREGEGATMHSGCT